jgi:hypothetical protein
LIQGKDYQNNLFVSIFSSLLLLAIITTRLFGASLFLIEPEELQVGGAGALARTILLASNLDQWRSGIGILISTYLEVAAGPVYHFSSL